jgi:micrococcal nuclease
MKNKFLFQFLTRSIAICGCGLLAIAGCQQRAAIVPSDAVTVQIQRVVNGQTIEWVDRSQEPPLLQQGRLSEIDAPDLRQEPWGKAAKQRLEAIIRERDNSIEIVADPTPDRFGRKLVKLWDRGKSIDEQLIREGRVLPNYRSTDTKTLDRAIAASQYARLMGEGIWDGSNPMRLPPSEFRREQ